MQANIIIFWANVYVHIQRLSQHFFLEIKTHFWLQTHFMISDYGASSGSYSRYYGQAIDTTVYEKFHQNLWPPIATLCKAPLNAYKKLIHL